MIKRERGITLVALVVTVVVLLILAGITIMYVMEDNGVFSKVQEAKNRTENAIEDEKEYMNGIGNTINKYTNGTGGGTITPPTTEGPTISDSSSESHTATTINYTWEQISKIAEAIAKSTSVDSSTMEVKANIDGIERTIGVGDIAIVKYKESETSEVERRVRVLGFKHDDLVNTGVYGSGITATKASISFEFLDFMTGSTYMSMNETSTNEGGWAATQMRKDLNGYTTNSETQSGAIGGLGAKLSNQGYIKQVKKQYIKKYNDTSSNNNYTNDYLWLLASSEVVNSGNYTGYYGYAITSEGSQYQYYQGVAEEWNAGSTNRVKKTSESGSTNYWWLRSPTYIYSSYFCTVGFGGNLNLGNLETYYAASIDNGVAPGFSI